LFCVQRWEAISDDAKDLIRQLLAPNPSDRLTASETLTHPWLVGHQLQEDDQTASIAIPHRSSTPLPLIEESPSMETVLRQGSTSQMRRDESFADLDLEHYVEHDELDMHE
jgi:serine/threonine protein kinase